MALLPFHQVVETEFQAVNRQIIEQLQSRVELVEDIGHYIVEAGGKRLRPLTVLLTARALGAEGDKAIHLATIIEFIHTATLLHDDVVDMSTLRRGRDTANALWGNAPSVLVGDFLYSRSFQMMVALNDMRVMDLLSETTNIIAEGEVLQLQHAGNPDISESRYKDVIHYKTAQLFQAAAEMGAIASNAGSELLSHMGRFGHHLGMAFQIMDDMLDYQGDSEMLGKNVGDDLAEGKPTLPLIYTMANGQTEHAKLIRDAILEKNRDALSDIVNIIQSNGALDYTLDQARYHHQQAAEQLTHLPESEYQQALIALTDFAISRNV